MKDALEILGVIAAVIAFMVLFVFAMIRFTEWKSGSECEDFCRDRGHDPHYNPTLGCFCEDENDELYNPEYLVPPGTSISITE